MSGLTCCWDVGGYRAWQDVCAAPRAPLTTTAAVWPIGGQSMQQALQLPGIQTHKHMSAAAAQTVLWHILAKWEELVQGRILGTQQERL